jgi:exopolyphosphatase/guanosine-5'-triphosphate,3'-diphosphate pyrophosphatase
MNERIGVIDIGTNTTRLAVFEVKSAGERVPLVRRSEITRLGQGVNRNRRLAPEAMERTLAVLDNYVAEARALGVNTLAGAGTSALRDAADAPQFVNAVRSRGVDFKVVAGEQEARLVFAGASAAFGKERDRPVLVIDAGGGSTELIRGRGISFEHAASLDIGAVRMTEQFLHNSPPAPEQTAAMEDFMRRAFEAASPEFSPGPQGTAAAVGGTIATLAALNLGTWDADRVHGLELTLDYMESVYAQLLGLAAADIAQLPGIEPKRADIITAGAGLYVCLLRAFELHSVRVSLHDIRHGICEAVLSGAWDEL